MASSRVLARASPTLPGQILAGKYRVERTLGEGGHGVVVAAVHLALGERVAIKLLKPEVAEDQETVARFLREARASVRIKGEHVTRVLDVGSTADGMPYIVMEHLDGHDLASAIVSKGWLPISVAVDYILQTCEALAEAHGLGIVHRDIKPSNLFLTTRTDGSPCIKVLDFGISKAMARVDGSSPDLNLTQTQTVLGSPQYMAPEQMRSSRVVDGRTDIWAIGTTLHELLTGRPPFEASTMPELFAMILQDPTPRLADRRPEMPETLEAIVARCLEKDPAKRFTDVHELARALGPLASSEGAALAERIGRVGFNASRSSNRLLPLDSGSAPGVDLSRTDKMVNGKSSREVTTAGRPRRSPFYLASLATFATAIAAVAIFFAVQRVRIHTHASTTTTTTTTTTTPTPPRDPPPAVTAEPIPTTVLLAASAAEPKADPPATSAATTATTTTTTTTPRPRASARAAGRGTPSSTSTAAAPTAPTAPTAPATTATQAPHTPGVASSRYD